MYRQKGFTLIELITVIAILGALAVIALPRYIDLQDEAEEAATDGVAGSLAAASATNLAGAIAGDDSGNVTAVAQCSDAALALSDQQVPADYSIVNGASFPATLGDATTCTVRNTGANPDIDRDFTAYAVPSADVP